MHTSKHLTTAIRRVNRKSSNLTRFTYVNHTIYVVFFFSSYVLYTTNTMSTNQYILGGGIGAHSRFSRSALTRRALSSPCHCYTLSITENNINNNQVEYNNSVLASDGTINNQVETFEIWYDGADYTQFQPQINTSTTSSSITQWNDKSASAHNANSYAGASPTAKPIYIGSSSNDVQNENTSVSFTASQNQGFEIGLTGGGNWLFGLQTITIFMVFKYKEPINNNLTIWSSSQNDLNLAVNSSNQLIMSSPKTTPTNSYNVDTNTVLDPDTWVLTTTTFNGFGAADEDKLRFRINGVEQNLTFSSPVGTTIGPNGGNGRIGIGMNVWNGGNTDFFNGNIGEVLVYSKALTTAEIDVIENYINTKWNIYSTE